VAIADLTRTSSDEEMGKQMEDLELGVSEALGISLLEVQARYFWDSDESMAWDLDGKCEHEHWLEEWAEEHQLEYQSYQEDAAL
jgi:hypothetical protein